MYSYVLYPKDASLYTCHMPASVSHTVADKGDKDACCPQMSESAEEMQVSKMSMRI